MPDARPTADQIAARARQLIAERLGRMALVSGPCIVDGRWEVSVWLGSEGRWAELTRLRFDALGRLAPVDWPRVYERAAALLAADDRLRRLIPSAPEPPITAEAAAISDIEPITGLPSLAVWEMRLRREVARWHRTREPFCAAWARLEIAATPSVSLTHNDRLALWRLAARRIAAETRREDLLAAGPPGEFALLLVADIQAARRAAKRMANAVSCPFRLYESGPEVNAILVIGLAEMTEDSTPQTLARLARQRCYVAAPNPAHTSARAPRPAPPPLTTQA